MNIQDFSGHGDQDIARRGLHHETDGGAYARCCIDAALYDRCSPRGAQTATSDVTIPPPPLKTVSLSGPRFGVTALSDGVVEKLHERSIDVGSSITQFGWQFEKEFYSKEGGVAALQRMGVAPRRARAGRGAAEPELAGRTSIASGAEFASVRTSHRRAWRWPLPAA